MMSWDDYRYNGLRTTIKEMLQGWILVRGTAINFQSQEIQHDAEARIDTLETVLQILDRWVLAVQEEEFEETR